MFTYYVRLALRGFRRNPGLTALMVLLFLGNWRSTLIIATAIPVSLLGAVAVMYFLGFTLNMVTLIALALVTGVLVDDAIVEILPHVPVERGRVVEHRHAIDEPEQPDLQLVVLGRPLPGLLHPPVR